MATNFPGSLDTLTNPTPTSSMSGALSHAGQHSDVNDAVEALQAKVGADSSAVTSSHDYKIADHASRIATLEGASGGGTVLIASSTFTSSSAISIDNCFTSDYSTYQIHLQSSQAGGASQIHMRFRSSGTDTSANYDIRDAVLRFNDGYFAQDGGGNAQTFMTLSYPSSARTHHSITVWEPYESTYTGMWYNAAQPDFAMWGGAAHTVDTSFDGFTIFPNTGTLTGTIYVYGWVKS